MLKYDTISCYDTYSLVQNSVFTHGQNGCRISPPAKICEGREFKRDTRRQPVGAARPAP